MSRARLLQIFGEGQYRDRREQTIIRNKRLTDAWTQWDGTSKTTTDRDVLLANCLWAIGRVVYSAESGLSEEEDAANRSGPVEDDEEEKKSED